MYYLGAHAHIYPDAIALKAAHSIADFYQIAMKEDGRLATLLARGAQAGITRHLVHSVGVTPDRVHSVNDYLLKTVQANPERLIGFGTLHPELAGIPAELARIRAGGLLGVKVHPDFQRFLLDGDAAMAMFGALADAGLSGAEAYANYGRDSGPVFQRVGGSIVWRGSMEAMLPRNCSPGKAAAVAEMSRPGFNAGR